VKLIWDFPEILDALRIFWEFWEKKKGDGAHIRLRKFPQLLYCGVGTALFPLFDSRGRSACPSRRSGNVNS
jgi:hypothetical protein